MKILILGGDSYVGGSFIRYFKDDFSLNVVSRKKTSFKGEIVCNDLDKLPDDVFREDDVVFNFLAIVHQPEENDHEFYYKVNHKLAVRLAEKAKIHGTGLFVQMSTIAVYGRTIFLNYETDENPENHYGRSKLLADRELLDLQGDSFSVLILRPPMIY